MLKSNYVRKSDEGGQNLLTDEQIERKLSKGVKVPLVSAKDITEFEVYYDLFKIRDPRSEIRE